MSKCYTKPIPLVFLIVMICQSCLVMTPGVTVNYDQVKQTTRIQKNFYYLFPIEKNTPFRAMDQIISKEINDQGDARYFLYDVISLSSGSFSLKKEVYLLIDDTVFKIIPLEMEQEVRQSIAESVSTTDSTSVKVVTGYQKDQWRDERLTYQLNDDHVNAIQEANLVKFRYYAGPHMITLVLKTTRLEKFKEVISATENV